MNIFSSQGRASGVLVLASAAVVMLSLSGCTSGAASTSSGPAAGGKTSGHITVAYMQKQGDQQYFIDEANGATQAAKALGNVTVKVINLGTDSNLSISQEQAVIAQKVNGIIIVVPDQKIGPQTTSLANAAKIPIMSSDDPLLNAQGVQAPFAGFNSTSMGQKVGAEAAKLYLASGFSAGDTRVISAGEQDLSDCTQRASGEASGFTSGLKGAAAPATIALGTDNSVTQAQDKAGAIITANPGVKNWVVWGCNDESETGVVTALQNAGVSADHIDGVGLGAYLDCKDWKAGQKTGNKASLFISGVAVGKTALTAMVKHIRDGAPLPKSAIAPTVMVDASNYVAAGVVCV
jgi:L-arabinose transport system substrate-binding protein